MSLNHPGDQVVNEAVSSELCGILGQVQKPWLPTQEQLGAYINEIDVSRWYSNRGPLAKRLEHRLSHLFGCNNPCVVSFSSGSLALEAAILEQAGRATERRPLALMPSYSFVATGLAALRCGYQPHFVDIDETNWMMEASTVDRHPLLEQAGLILPVAAYGRRPNVKAWESLKEATSIPIVIDAAAAFEAYARESGLVSSTVPAVLSFHATKSFSTAEGGAVLINNHEAQLRLCALSNFGLDEARNCLLPGMNGKLSEYHAAVGLACLDNWTARIKRLAQLTECYLQHQIDGLANWITTPSISSSYILVESYSESIAIRIRDALTSHGIASRKWYSGGMALEPVFTSMTADKLPVTEDLSKRLLGVPAAIDLEPEDVRRVASVIKSVG